jgi:hypothetical protein
MLIGTQVRVIVSYDVACDICGVLRVDALTFDTRAEAEDYRRAHIQEHRGSDG